MDRRAAEPRSRIEARDAGLSLLGRLRRWLIVASLGLVGAFAGLVAQAKPGRSATTTPGSSGGANAGAGPSQRQAGGGAAAASAPAPAEPAPAISPPPQAPLPAPATPAPPVVSGGS
jgi:hypothetical protein